MKAALIDKIERKINELINQIDEIDDSNICWRQSRESDRQDALLKKEAAKAEILHDLIRVHDHGMTTMRETMNELEGLRELVVQLRGNFAQAA